MLIMDQTMEENLTSRDTAIFLLWFPPFRFCFKPREVYFESSSGNKF